MNKSSSYIHNNTTAYFPRHNSEQTKPATNSAFYTIIFINSSESCNMNLC